MGFRLFTLLDVHFTKSFQTIELVPKAQNDQINWIEKDSKLFSLAQPTDIMVLEEKALTQAFSVSDFKQPWNQYKNKRT